MISIHTLTIGRTVRYGSRISKRFNCEALGDRIFVKVSESEERTAGGILLPDNAREKPQVGEVTAVVPANSLKTASVSPWM